MNLTNQTAIVTGAGNGIGRATALRLAAAGAKVTVADIEGDSAEATAQYIRSQGGEALAETVDMGVSADISRMVADTVAAFGGVQILVNNAVWYKGGTALDTTEEQWDRTVSVCLKGAWLAAKAALPHMLAAGGGSIVNIGSVHSVVGFPRSLAYDVVKAGLTGMTRSLAIDFAPTVRANCLLPGGVETRLWSRVSEEDRRRIVDATLLQRLGTPEEIAEGVLFLASPASSFMTGACLLLDGGWTAI